MSRFARSVAVCLVVLLACSVVVAQEPGKGSPRPRGMFGGGAFGFSPAMMWGRLLTLEAVQKELELVSEQKEKLKDVAEKAGAKARESFAAMGKLRDASEEERKAKFEEMGNTMRAQAEQTKKQIEEILLPHQVERLKQITLQIRGLGALEDKEVQDALGITEQQKEKMKSLGESAIEKFRGMMGRGGDENERKARREKMESARKELEGQILDILTPEQKEKFDKMKGAKIDIDMSQLMPRRPGRGGPDEKK